MVDDSDKAGGPGVTSAPPNQKPIGGLVIDPREVKTNPSLTKYLRERIGAGIIGSVLGNDGGSATVNATVLYRVGGARETDVYRNVGRNCGTSLARPTARGCGRSAFTQYIITAGASTASGAIQDSIAGCVKEKLGSE